VIEVDGTSFRDLQRELREMAPDVRKRLNEGLKDILLRRVIPDARGNASWSSRIPGAIQPQVTMSRIAAIVRPANAPHARPFEGISKGEFGRSRASFRHPVFGNRNFWVEQRTRPFLVPAFDANRKAAADEAVKAIDDAARQVGFR
jgi:hypothetical protein